MLLVSQGFQGVYINLRSLILFFYLFVYFFVRNIVVEFFYDLRDIVLYDVCNS